MREFFKENIFKIAIIIPITVSILGMVIINLYISNYGIIDYTIFRIQSIYVGTSFVIFCTGFFILYCMFIDTSNLEQNRTPKIILITSIKTILISVLFYTYCTGEILNPPYLLFTKISLLMFLIISVPLIFFLYVHLKENYHNIISNEVPVKYKIPSITYISVSVLYNFFLFVVLFRTETIFRYISGFFMFYGLMFVFGLELHKRVKKDKKKVAKSKYTSLFSSKKNKASMILENMFWYFGLLAFIISLMILYSKLIYPNLLQFLGGGKEQTTTIVSKQQEMSGKIVHSNERFIYFLSDTNTIEIIHWDDVIKMKPSSIKTEGDNKSGKVIQSIFTNELNVRNSWSTKIYDITGNYITDIKTNWDGKNSEGNTVKPGIYFIKSNGQIVTKAIKLW